MGVRWGRQELVFQRGGKCEDWIFGECLSGLIDGVADDHPRRSTYQTQPFGQTSKQSLSDLVYGKTVTVDTGKTDRCGREVGKILVDGMDATREQVRRGLAWQYKAYQREQPPVWTAEPTPQPKKTPQRPTLACDKMMVR